MVKKTLLNIFRPSAAGDIRFPGIGKALAIALTLAVGGVNPALADHSDEGHLNFRGERHPFQVLAEYKAACGIDFVPPGIAQKAWRFTRNPHWMAQIEPRERAWRWWLTQTDVRDIDIFIVGHRWSEPAIHSIVNRALRTSFSETILLFCPHGPSSPIQQFRQTKAILGGYEDDLMFSVPTELMIVLYKNPRPF